MEQLFALANSYYFEFESYRRKISDLWLIWFLTILSAILFVGYTICVVSDVHDLSKTNIFLKKEPWVLLVFELVFLSLMNKLQEKKRILILKKHGESKDNPKSYLRIKRKWICENTGINNEEFFDVAKKFDEMHSLYLTRLGFFDNYGKNLIKRLYDSDSKPRILTLLIFLFSMVFLLLLKGISDNSTILSLFEYESAKFFVLYVIVFSILLFVFLETIYALLKIISISLTIFSINVENRKSQSTEIIRIFIKDLIYLHRLRPIKLKINKNN